MKLLTKSNLLSSNLVLKDYNASKLRVLSTKIARTNIRENKMTVIKILMMTKMRRERFHLNLLLNV